VQIQVALQAEETAMDLAITDVVIVAAPVAKTVGNNAVGHRIPFALFFHVYLTRARLIEAIYDYQK
jgi:BarA-like signal transduction histidine kinase